MTNSAKTSLNAARAAKAAALTRRIVARQLGAHGHGIHSIARMREAGRTASGYIIHKIDQPPGRQIKNTAAAAGKPQGAEHWPDPRKADAKPRPEFCVTSNGKPLSPKLAALIASRIKPIDPRCAEVRRLEDKLTGPKDKPSDWPASVPWYSGTTIDIGIAKTVAAAEARDAR